MHRIEWVLLGWLLLSFVACVQQRASSSSSSSCSCSSSSSSSSEQRKQRDCHHDRPVCNNNGRKKGSCKCRCKIERRRKRVGRPKAKCCMEDVRNTLNVGNLTETIEAFESLEEVLEDTDINDTLTLFGDGFVAHLHKPRGPFKGLEISASEDKAVSNEAVRNGKVHIRLPQELHAELNNTIVFCMFNVNKKALGTSAELYEQRIIGLSVRGMNVSGLQEPVNITVNLSTEINETQAPSCEFFSFSTGEFNSSGCTTDWVPGQDYIKCSCNHLTYFGILLVSTSATLSVEDRKILTYITLIGCSLSLLALVFTVLLFITNRRIRADLSMKVHINLAIALLLLNLHFLPSQWVAAMPSTGPCIYIAVALHFSLLATFCWMAIEAFHLYLLLVRVFNVYVRRYLLKLSAVGWGVPVVIVSLVSIANRDTYGRAPMDSSNFNDTAICYITDNTIKIVTTVGVFSLVFLFNLAMFGVTIKRVVMLRRTKEYGQVDRDRTQRDICTLLGVTVLLGITWGLVFFSFGYLEAPGLYAFCILNSLQGFFLFLWFIMSLRKKGNSAAPSSSETRNTNT